MKNTTPNNNKNSEKKPFDLSGYTRYSSIGFQLIAAVAIGFGAGYFVDNFFSFELPFFKVIFSFLGVLIGLYIVIKEVSRKD